jgi:hypothetical protein
MLLDTVGCQPQVLSCLDRAKFPQTTFTSCACLFLPLGYGDAPMLCTHSGAFPFSLPFFHFAFPCPFLRFPPACSLDLACLPARHSFCCLASLLISRLLFSSSRSPPKLLSPTRAANQHPLGGWSLMFTKPFRWCIVLACSSNGVACLVLACLALPWR